MAVSIARMYDISFETACDVAVSFAPSFDAERFAVCFTIALGNRIGRRVPLNDVVKELIKVK